MQTSTDKAVSVQKPLTYVQRRKKFGHLLTHFALLSVLLIFLFPLYWLVVSSFKTLDTVFRVPFEWLPEKWSLEGFKTGWTFMGDVTFTRVYLNTFYVAFVSVAGTVVTATMVAYGFARLNFIGKKFWFVVLLGTMMLPSQVTLVPNYLIFNFLHLIDTYLVLYIGAFFGGGAFFIFLIRQHIMGIPMELDESAKMDGATSFRIFWSIILPLCKNVLAAVAIFSFSWSYGDFMTPLIYINSAEKYTLPIAMVTFLDEAGGGNLGAAISMSLIGILPLLIIFFVGQKQFMVSVTSSGVKG
jgi:ABC-type glycerol-3-phosphate transport system permease component